MSSPDLAAALSAERRALEAFRAVEREVDEECRKACAEIDARYASRLDAARSALGQARQAVVEARERTPAHEWAGRKVFRVRQVYRSWRMSDQVTDFGIVEMRVRDTKMPENVSHYTMPKIGEPFVRMLKKDGSTGVKICPSLSGWSLVASEEEK